MKKEAIISEELESYNFPEHNITVQAKDLPDAMEKLREILAANS